MKASEAELVRVLCGCLKREGYDVRTEIANMGQSIDIVAVREEKITAIEVKVKDWRRALDQCRAHELIADYVCVAVGTVSVSAALLDAAKKRGYGLIHIRSAAGTCEWVRAAQQSTHVWLPQRRHFVSGLSDVPTFGEEPTL